MMNVHQLIEISFAHGEALSFQYFIEIIFIHESFPLRLSVITLLAFIQILEYKIGISKNYDF